MRIRAEPRKPAKEEADVMQGVKERQRSSFYDHAVTRLTNADLKAETDGGGMDCGMGKRRNAQKIDLNIII